MTDAPSPCPEKPRQVEQHPQECEPSDRVELQDQSQQDLQSLQPQTSSLKRAVLIVLMLLLFWVMKKSFWEKKEPQIIYASRYSKEHKFRPAASPIITQTLKDGRIKIYGAAPTASPDPQAISQKKKARLSKRKPKQTTKGRKPVRKLQ